MRYLYNLNLPYLQFYKQKMKRNISRGALSKENEIQGLKQQVFQLKDLEYDLFRLNDQIASIEAKYGMVLEEKDRNEQLLKSKMQISKKSLQDLQADVDGIKLQIDQTSIDVANLTRDNATLMKTCDNRQSQIMNLTVALKELEKTNQLKNMELQELEEMLTKVKQHKLKMEEECEKLCRRLDESKDGFKQLDKQTKNQIVMQKSLGSTLEKLKYEGNQLMTQMKARQSLLNEISQQHEELTDQVAQSTETKQKLEKQKKKLQQTNLQLTKTLEHTQRVNKQKEVQLKQLQQNVLKASQELEKSGCRKGDMMKQHTQLATVNKNLNLEIDDCLIKIMQLDNVNKVLQKHIENYIDCDEQARILLDRKQKMTQVLQTVGSKLSKTEAVIAHLR